MENTVLTLPDLIAKIKEALSTKNLEKWHFLVGVINGKEVKIKVFAGKSEADLQGFSIDGKQCTIGFNYESRSKTSKAMIEKLEKYSF